MQVDTTLSVFSSGGSTPPAMTRNAGSQTALSGMRAPEVPAVPRNNFDSGAVLAELPARPALSALASGDGAGTGTAVLRESTGSGGVPAQMAAALYALNRSFDIQALALDLLV